MNSPTNLLGSPSFSKIELPGSPVTPPPHGMTELFRDIFYLPQNQHYLTGPNPPSPPSRESTPPPNMTKLFFDLFYLPQNQHYLTGPNPPSPPPGYTPPYARASAGTLQNNDHLSETSASRKRNRQEESELDSEHAPIKQAAALFPYQRK